MGFFFIRNDDGQAWLFCFIYVGIFEYLRKLELRGIATWYWISFSDNKSIMKVIFMMFLQLRFIIKAILFHSKHEWIIGVYEIFAPIRISEELFNIEYFTPGFLNSFEILFWVKVRGACLF